MLDSAYGIDRYETNLNRFESGDNVRPNRIVLPDGLLQSLSQGNAPIDSFLKRPTAPGKALAIGPGPSPSGGLSNGPVETRILGNGQVTRSEVVLPLSANARILGGGEGPGQAAGDSRQGLIRSQGMLICIAGRRLISSRMISSGVGVPAQCA